MDSIPEITVNWAVWAVALINVCYAALHAFLAYHSPPKPYENWKQVTAGVTAVGLCIIGAFYAVTGDIGLTFTLAVIYFGSYAIPGLLMIATQVFKSLRDEDTASNMRNSRR